MRNTHEIVFYVDIDECSSDPCKNEATCIDGVNMFSCFCAQGFTGPLCDIGQSSNYISFFNYSALSCTCTQFYHDILCVFMIDVNECASTPCRNGATCVDKVNSFECLCPSGLEGFLCDIGKFIAFFRNFVAIFKLFSLYLLHYLCILLTESGPCSTVTCENGGSCFDTPEGRYTCTCAQGFVGNLCQFEGMKRSCTCTCIQFCCINNKFQF